MKNEKKNLSRIRKRRIERKIKMDDKMESILHKVKSEKKERSRNNIKIKE